MWQNNRISVVFSTYNEKDSIKQCIDNFFHTGVVDEVIVVNNNAAEGTDEEVKKTRAKLFHETMQGFGHGYIKALKMAKGDIVIMTESDGTFNANDIFKLLAYSDDFNVVFGTRTTSILIGQGANMGFLMKWGNVLVAKLAEILFNTTQLTDVGCTYRLIKRTALAEIENKFTVQGNAFNLDMMLQVIKNGIDFIEIPINYKKRVGISTVTGNKVKAFFLGLSMVFLIFRHRFGLIKIRKYIPQKAFES